MPFDKPSAPSQYYKIDDLVNRYAICCATVRDFVVIGGLSNDSFGIRWCAIGDPTSWPTPSTDAARAVQAGAQSFPSRHGVVTAIAGNDFYMYVFQTNAISKGTYVGADTVWSFDIFEEDRGCVEPGQMEQIDDMVVFRSDRGKHILQNDQIVDIGYGITDDTL